MAKTELTVDLDEDEPTDAVAVVSEQPVDLDGEAIVNEDASELDRLPDQAILNADGTVTLSLVYPQVVSSRKDNKIHHRDFKSLTFHRLNGGDQRAIAAASDQMQTVVAFSRSTRINQAVMNALFDKMDMADITNAGRVLNYFLTSGRKTGR